MRNLLTTVGAVSLAAAMLVSASGQAGAETLQQKHDRLAKQKAQLQVQVNLSIASDDALVAEVNRLDRAVALQNRLLYSEQQAVQQANAQVAAAQARLDAINAAAQRARRALVDRAIDLYEHPFQTAQVVLTGVASVGEYARRQELVSAVEGSTAELLDQYRQQELDQYDASRALFAARDRLVKDEQAVQSYATLLDTAQSSAQRAHAEEQKRITALQTEIQGLAAQESALEAKLAASEATNASAFDASFRGPSRLVWPVHGPVTQEFGYHWGGFHPGIDIAPPYGTPIHAAGTGVVIYASWESGYGNYTCIDHGGGLSTCYGHQSQIDVSVGQLVQQGQVIGLEGSTGYSTGPHVHFETRVNHAPENPRNFVPGNP